MVMSESYYRGIGENSAATSELEDVFRPGCGAIERIGGIWSSHVTNLPRGKSTIMLWYKSIRGSTGESTSDVKGRARLDCSSNAVTRSPCHERSTILYLLR